MLILETRYIQFNALTPAFLVSLACKFAIFCFGSMEGRDKMPLGLGNEPICRNLSYKPFWKLFLEYILPKFDNSMLGKLKPIISEVKIDI